MPKKNAEKCQNFYCTFCPFVCSKQSNYDKHLLTRKHKNLINPNENPNEKNAEIKIHNCECGKTYKHLSSLCSHKKKCFIGNEEITNQKINNKNDLQTLTNIVLEIVKNNEELQKQNQEFKDLLMKQSDSFQQSIIEICKNGTTTSNIQNINNTNSHNKTFNLQVFLNETCKNAMNIMDFMDSIQLQLSDLEKVGQLGYVDGISDIIIKNLKALDVTERPVHCSDSKREVVYVKDENKWEKENAESEKMRKAIKRVAHKNIQLIPEWKEKFPDCVYSNSTKSDQYNHIVIEAMGGDYKTDRKDSENRIIKKIAKEVVIDK